MTAPKLAEPLPIRQGAGAPSPHRPPQDVLSASVPPDPHCLPFDDQIGYSEPRCFRRMRPTAVVVAGSVLGGDGGTRE